MRRLLTLGLLATLAVTLDAAAQTPVHRIRGTVQALDGNTLTVLGREGDTSLSGATS